MNDSSLDGVYLSRHPLAQAEFDAALRRAASAVRSTLRSLARPTRGATFAEIARRIGEIEVCPERGVGLDRAIHEVREHVLPDVVNLSHPAYAAHLHCPPMVASVTAELLIGATNQSLDSFDQAPSATAVEMRVVEWLLELTGYGTGGDGVLTCGATQSNLMGLLLARDRHAERALGWSARERGLPDEAARWRILCSRAAHFSIARGARILGLGERSLLEVPSCADGPLDVGALSHVIEGALQRGERPIALVLTAGTTEHGCIDPLEAAIDIATRHGIWTHVDAAVGGALLLSRRHRGRLRGIDRADSVALDFHKLLGQAIGCGVFLVRERSRMELLRSHASYLNPESDEEEETPHLVRKSLHTTRRFDALKIFLSSRALGRAMLERVVDRILDITLEAAGFVRASRTLQLLGDPQTNVLRVRWEPPDLRDDVRLIDKVNRQLPARLWRAGRAVIGRSLEGERPILRLTFVHALRDSADLAALVRSIEEEADRAKDAAIAWTAEGRLA